MKFSHNPITPRPLTKNDPFDLQLSFGDDCNGPVERLFENLRRYIVGLKLTDGKQLDIEVLDLTRDMQLLDDPRLTGYGLRGMQMLEDFHRGDEITIPIEHIESVHIY